MVSVPINPINPMNQGETARYRILFSLGCAGGFSLLCWTHTYFGLKYYEVWSGPLGSPGRWLPRIPPYPLGYWVLFLGLLVFVPVYCQRSIMKRLPIRQNSTSRSLFVFLVFVTVTGVSLLNFGLHVYMATHGLTYAVAFALIDAVRSYTDDFSFLRCAELSEAVKLAKLQMMYERWFWYSLTVLTVGCGLLIGMAVQGTLATSKEFKGQNAIAAALVVGYLLVAIGWGIIADLFRKARDIEARTLEVGATETRTDGPGNARANVDPS